MSERDGLQPRGKADVPELPFLSAPRVNLARVPHSKHATVATALVEAVLHPAFSKLAADDLVLPSQRRTEYVAALAESILLRFQPGTVAAVLRTWNRYIQWHLDLHLELTSRDVTVKKFLLAQEARGRTVAAAVFQHLKWLREELQVPLPLESPLFKPFASAATATAVLGAPSPAEFHRAGSPRGRFRGACCSFWLTIQALLQATLAPESGGKDGLPFAVSLPTCTATANDLLLQLQEAAQRTIGASGPFLPDMYFEPLGGVVIRSACASSSRFLSFCRSLLMLPPLSLSADNASQFSTRSLRRFLPTVADAISLPESHKLCLGNWSNGRRLPLPVRYAAVAVAPKANSWGRVERLRIEVRQIFLHNASKLRRSIGLASSSSASACSKPATSRSSKPFREKASRSSSSCAV